MLCYNDSLLTTCCITTPVLTFSAFDDSTSSCCGDTTFRRCQRVGTTFCSTIHVLTFSVGSAFQRDAILCRVFLHFVLYVSTLSSVILLDVLCSVKVLGGLIVGGVTL